ncbi:hypothetical protein, partial [Paraburkholderia sp. RL17-347-BIC-D]|uniref:hypothetical protein n=1 Tax=Paraburkholderia sp. RL17-347-BIC-D TaxID=3031632 RepID=UPI0038BC564C
FWPRGCSGRRGTEQVYQDRFDVVVRERLGMSKKPGARFRARLPSLDSAMRPTGVINDLRPE